MKYQEAKRRGMQLDQDSKGYEVHTSVILTLSCFDSALGKTIKVHNEV